MTDQHRAYRFAIAAVVLWSTVASAFKLTLQHVSPVQLLFYASLFSTLILATVLTARGQLRVALACGARDYGRSLLLGLLNPLAYYLILFEAYDRLPAQEAQTLNYTWGLTLPLLSVPLLRQRIGKRDLVALVLGYAGVFVISTRGDVTGFRLSDPMGVGLALGSAFIWALYWIYNTKDQRDPVACLFLSFLLATPLTFAAYAILSDVALPSWRGLAGCAYVGAFEMSVTFSLWLAALKHSENTAKVSTLIFASPFISLLLIRVFVGEAILPSTILGLLLIVGGLTVQRIRAKGGQMA